MIDITRDIVVATRLVRHCDTCNFLFVSDVQECVHCDSTSGHALTDESGMPLDADSPKGREYCAQRGVEIRD